MASILVFPANTSESCYQATLLRSAGHYVIGAGCDIEQILSDDAYDELVPLPHMASTQFIAAFQQLHQQHQFHWVVSFHFVVRSRLAELSQQQGWGLEFLNARADRSFVAQQQRYQHLLARFKVNALAQGLAIDSTRLLPEWQQLILLQHFDAITGESPYEKILAMLVIAAAAPAGDVVEIGCLYGKSAFALGYLNQQYQIGKLLCIDPWQAQMSLQQEAASIVQSVDRHEIFSIGYRYFVQNLQPYFNGSMNVLQMCSDQAYTHYVEQDCVASAQFGETVYQRRISVLHIDGNHDYAYVQQELDTWGSCVIAGGWIIVDDYLWGLGSGPDKAGNAFLQHHQHRIQHAFVIGEALFIQLKTAQIEG